MSTYEIVNGGTLKSMKNAPRKVVVRRSRIFAYRSASSNRIRRSLESVGIRLSVMVTIDY